ncbi:LysR family transcriptional regulator [Dethiothermospora halolimnae]|uniref:LysR family transcriptional regulator n=1 Tax=Dethiothermospora halolimnae TaxID=3114390 RepID=UPI003CCBF50F
MSIKLDLYKVFNAVCKYESFSKAGKVLYMTQPAVSQAIMQLERELEVGLFIRNSRGVKATKEGKLLFEYISSALNLIDAGEKKVHESKELMSGELKVGVGDTISRYFLLPYLEVFHNRYPNIDLKIINRTTLELCPLLKSGKIDIAICNLPIKDTSIKVKELMDIEDIFVCGQKYKNQISKDINLEDLGKFPLILLEPTSNSRQYVEKYMLTKGIKIKPEIELGSHDLLLEFAKINLGISCVVKEFSKQYLDKGVLYELPITEKIPKRGIGVCFLKSLSLSPSSVKFVEILEEKS